MNQGIRLNENPQLFLKKERRFYVYWTFSIDRLGRCRNPPENQLNRVDRLEMHAILYLRLAGYPAGSHKHLPFGMLLSSANCRE